MKSIIIALLGWLLLAIPATSLADDRMIVATTTCSESTGMCTEMVTVWVRDQNGMWVIYSQTQRQYPFKRQEQ